MSTIDDDVKEHRTEIDLPINKVVALFVNEYGGIITIERCDRCFLIFLALSQVFNNAGFAYFFGYDHLKKVVAFDMPVQQ